MNPTATFLTIATCAVFAVLGVLHARRLARASARRDDVEGYLTARNSIGTGVSVATLVATLAGTWILASPAFVVLMMGGALALVAYGLAQASPMFLFPLVGPRLRRLMPNGHSLSEFVRHRYGAPMQLLVSAIALFYMSVYLAAELSAIALAGEALGGIPLILTAAVVAVGTAIYAAWGGLRTAIFADRIQVALIVGLLLIVAVTVTIAVHGVSAGLQPAREAQPELFKVSALGWSTAAVLFIGIIASNLFDNSFWQRVFVCRDDRVVQRSFALSGLCIAPIIIIAGGLSLYAVGRLNVTADNASTSLFDLVHAVAAPWVGLVVLVLALVLAMSTLAALMNAIGGLASADAKTLKPATSARALLRIGRWLPLLLVAGAVGVASRRVDPTYLFYVANLVCAGAVVPVFAGFWLRHPGGGGALLAALSGIALGVVWFPKNLMEEPWLATLPWGQSFLHSLILAVGVSSAVFVIAALASKAARAPFDFATVRERVRTLA